MLTVRTNGIETHYVRRGDGPPVVFVHAMAMSATMWEAQLEALEDAYTVVAYDVRGHGHTGGSDAPTYSMDLFAADLDALLDALGIDRAVVCGISMGGAVAQTFAAAHPEKVAGLVLADTFATGPAPVAGRIAMANVRVLARIDRFVRYETLNRIQMWIAQRLVPGMAGDAVTVQRLMEEAPTIPHDEFVKIADATALFTKRDLDLSVVTAPGLVLQGEHLPAGFEAWAERLVEQLPNADPEVRVVPGGGHASNLDNPEFFTAVLGTFLEERAFATP